MTWCLRMGVCALLVVTASAVSAQQPDEPRPEQERPLRISPAAYVQFDWRGYPDWGVVTGSGRLNRDTLEIRRMRLGVDGDWRRLSFEFTLDPQDNDGVLIKDAYVQIRLRDALRFRVGQFKLPGSREYGTSARTVDFLERSALADSIASGRDIGAMVISDIGRFDFRGGLFAGDGHGRGSRADLTAAGRITWDVASGLDVATSFSRGTNASIDSNPANGLDGRSSSGYRFFEGLYVQGGRTRVGVDVAWSPGPWQVAVEGLRARDERLEQGQVFETLPSLVGVGWSAAVVRQFGRRQGQGRSRSSEWDLSLRYDALAFDDVGPETEADSVRPRATDVRARSVRTWTAGASWEPMRWARVLSDVSLERYDEARSAPQAGRRGNYWTFGTRLQLELP